MRRLKNRADKFPKKSYNYVIAPPSHVKLPIIMRDDIEQTNKIPSYLVYLLREWGHDKNPWENIKIVLDDIENKSMYQLNIYLLDEMRNEIANFEQDKELVGHAEYNLGLWQDFKREVFLYFRRDPHRGDDE